MKATLPSKTLNLLDSYLNLRIFHFSFACPYYQNISNKKSKPVFVGKGNPDEIQKETEKLLNSAINILDIQSVRLYMVMAGLGIDCSGLVCRILDQYLEEKYNKSLKRSIKIPFYKPLLFIKCFLKPFTNISANSLTSQTNTVKIDNYDDLVPSDLIRFGSTHVVIIVEVEKENGKTKKISYAHSTSSYLDQYGVRIGNIMITNPNKPLESQKWNEVLDSKNWTLKNYLNSPKNDRGIRRIKSLTG
ncbi:hypothetical protein KW795_01190 [Candidatus Microgenomates bacterium]|nr:hypothetical protein [Candidatus Microgenomates bacterium]